VIYTAHIFRLTAWQNKTFVLCVCACSEYWNTRWRWCDLHLKALDHPALISLCASDPVGVSRLLMSGPLWELNATSVEGQKKWEGRLYNDEEGSSVQQFGLLYIFCTCQTFSGSSSSDKLSYLRITDLQERSLLAIFFLSVPTKSSDCRQVQFNSDYFV